MDKAIVTIGIFTSFWACFGADIVAWFNRNPDPDTVRVTDDMGYKPLLK